MIIFVACSKMIEDDVRHFFSKIQDVDLTDLKANDILMNGIGRYSDPKKKYIVIDDEYIYHLNTLVVHPKTIKGLYFIKDSHAEDNHKDFIKYEANYPQQFLTSYYSMLFSVGMVKSILRFLGCQDDIIMMENSNIVVADDSFSITSKANV